MGERFLDNQRIEGSIPEMLEGANGFVRKNMRTKTIIDSDTGKRQDRTDYPVTAIREAILNALVHRDYSIHTEGMPINQLGKMQPDTRSVSAYYRKLVDALHRIFNQDANSDITNHIFAIYEILKTSMGKDSARTFRPYYSK